MFGDVAVDTIYVQQQKEHQQPQKHVIALLGLRSNCRTSYYDYQWHQYSALLRVAAAARSGCRAGHGHLLWRVVANQAAGRRVWLLDQYLCAVGSGGGDLLHVQRLSMSDALDCKQFAALLNWRQAYLKRTRRSGG